MISQVAKMLSIAVCVLCSSISMSMVCRNYSLSALTRLSVRYKTSFGAVTLNSLLSVIFIHTRFVCFSVIVRKYSVVLAFLGCLWLYFWIAAQFVSIRFVFYRCIFSVFAFRVNK